MTESLNTCYQCGEKKLQVLQDFPRLVICGACGLVYNPALSIDPRDIAHHFYDDVNVEHRLKIQSVLFSIASIRWRWLKKRLPKAAGRLLEIGCGTGEFLKTAKADGWNVSGLELSESFRIAARKWYGLELDGEELAKAGIADKSFELVTLFHVFEHLTDPREFINQFSRILRPGGWLFIVVPNFSSWTDNLFGKNNPTLVKMDHYFLYNTVTLQQIFNLSDFDIVDISTMEPSHHIWTCLYGYLGSKNSPKNSSTAVGEKTHFRQIIGKIKSNIPYLVGYISSVFLYPFRFWLQKTNRGHEIYFLCRRK